MKLHFSGLPLIFRCESQQSSSQNPPDLGLQLSDLEQCHSREESSEEIEIEGLPSISSGASYDVPTRALVNAVRSASARAPATRSMVSHMIKFWFSCLYIFQKVNYKDLQN